jgi:hypothetical protein
LSGNRGLPIAFGQQRLWRGPLIAFLGSHEAPQRDPAAASGARLSFSTLTRLAEHAGQSMLGYSVDQRV